MLLLAIERQDSYDELMSGVTRHVRVGIVLVVATLLGIGPLQTLAASAPTTLEVAETPQVIVTEIQLTENSASEEFIELYNATNADIDFADTEGGGHISWKVQFFSASSTTTGSPDWSKPTTSVILTGLIPAHGYYVLASNGYVPAGLEGDQSYSSRMSDAGGGLQIVSITGTASTAHDRVMWQQASEGKVLPEAVWASPAAHESLQRMPTEEDTYSEAGKLTDFVISSPITPGDMWSPALPDPEEPDEDVPADDPNGTVPPESDDPAGDPSGDPESPPIETPASTDGLKPPFLTELLPNPAAPAKDESDEYVEMYNPNDVPFPLAGYSLQVGKTTLHNFAFADNVVMPAMSYMAFYSVDTRLTLTNTGGQARLLGADEAIVSEATAYETAPEGQAWALQAGTWQWTIEPTPALANIITLPTPKAAKPKTVKAPAAKKLKGTTTTKKATAKKASTKTAKAKKPKKTTVKTVNTAAIAPAEQPKTTIHTGVLAGVAALAVLYGAYEYRHDISNRLRQLRRHRPVRSYAGR